jgi:hypothetical protein
MQRALAHQVAIILAVTFVLSLGPPPSMLD